MSRAVQYAWNSGARGTWRAAVAVSVVIAALSQAPVASAQPQERQIDLLIGEQTTLPAEGVESFSEGRKGIVDVRVAPDGTQFIIVAERPGRTTLLLIMQDGRQINYNINVREEPEEEEAGIVEVDNIRLDFYFVQLSESYTHQIGVGWPAAIGGDEVATFTASIDMLDPNVLGATAVISNQPLPRIDLLQTQGWAKMMRQVAFITANGNQARFKSGGEVNVPVGGLTGALETVEFGSNVSVRPEYDQATNRIELRINANVSSLTDDRGTGVPGRDTSTLETKVNLEMGQAVVLAGLISDEQRASQSGLPGLSQIPIIGPLFGTNSLNETATQNVLFIVPSVVDVVSQNARRRISDAFEVYWGYSGGLLYNADLEGIQLLPTPEGTPSAAEEGAQQLGEQED